MNITMCMMEKDNMKTLPRLETGADVMFFPLKAQTQQETRQQRTARPVKSILKMPSKSKSEGDKDGERRMRWGEKATNNKMKRSVNFSIGDCRWSATPVIANTPKKSSSAEPMRPPPRPGCTPSRSATQIDMPKRPMRKAQSIGDFEVLIDKFKEEHIPEPVDCPDESAKDDLNAVVEALEGLESFLKLLNTKDDRKEVLTHQMKQVLSS